MKMGRCGFVSQLFMVRQPTITKGIILTLCISVASLLCLSYYAASSNNHIVRRDTPQPSVNCRTEADLLQKLNDHTSKASIRLSDKVLILVETPYTPHSQEIIAILEAVRKKYKVELITNALPSLTHMDKGRFAVVIFEKWELYLNMDKWNRQLLDKYCRDYDVGMISFTLPDNPMVHAQMKGFPLYVHTQLTLKDFEINGDSPILRITRSGEISYGDLPGNDWTVFLPNHTAYTPLAFAKLSPSNNQDTSEETTTKPTIFITAIHDQGEYDGIKRVLFGNNFKFWIHRLLFLDSLSYLSHGKLSIPLERYVLIDIDDIFVGKSGIRMKTDDVHALIASQARLQKDISNFHFNLGFSGKYFQRGSDEENKGDKALLDSRESFWWFGHSWSHSQPHLYDNLSLLVNDMTLNKMFAIEHQIPVNQSYAVAPHHSGVFPVHENLYEAWKGVWGVKVTSTEEYPHLRHARHRRGFIYKGIQVLPRQTCGLFTHTIFLDRYPGGKQKLENSIRGGELFQTFIYNTVLIFMTHLSNYGNDRLGLYTFESQVKFLKCWTNLKLHTIPPMEMANKYFDMHPEEKDPIWRNPCHDKRHKEIWSNSKSCEKLPSFLVIGPQKTGTSALHTFLSMHPNIESNLNSPTTFEEVQFFNGKNYYKGLDWYMSFFDLPSNGSTVFFEKSANYFDAPLAMERAHALLPHAKLICIMINPSKRAYSWYQHQRAHGDAVATSYSFHDVVTAGEDAQEDLWELRNRCLGPGLYAEHLERWLKYYHAKQILILDGDELKVDPVAVMNKVQQFLQIENPVDFAGKLKFSQKKGFYCMVTNTNKTKCLGKGKGRLYPPMDPSTESILHDYYRKANIGLSKLLQKMGQPMLGWLEQELRDSD